MTNYWLMKSEPDTFSIDDLTKLKIAPWDGVRNYQARNYLKSMRCHDLAFFYHSSCKIPGIVGVVEIVREAYPDSTAFDSKSQYFDLKSTSLNPRWFAVDVKLVNKFSSILSLSKLKQENSLKDMVLLKPGNRLSIFPVSAAHFNLIVRISNGK